MRPYFFGIVLTASLGGILRLLILRSDYRQYPTYPHGYISHLSMGFVAAALGAVAWPALLEEEFVAVTFLAMAAQQFREIRNLERESLASLDIIELVPRGRHYIEGIARTFEARNYIIIACTLTLSAIDLTFLQSQTIFLRIVILGVVTVLIYFFINFVFPDKRLEDLADIRLGKVHFQGPNVFVDDIHFMNIGLEEAKEEYLNKALGLVIEPKDIDASATLANPGQRQAVIHICAKLLGVYKDVDTPEFTPLMRRHIKSGNLGVLIIPGSGDPQALIAAVKRSPVLEGAMAKPSKSFAGREREDYHDTPR
jgi:hypothetical protein